MTNCPNCGAPYTLHSRVCEYCGTVREKLPDEIRVEQELEQARMDVEQAKQNLCLLQFETAQRAQFDSLVQSALREEAERRKSAAPELYFTRKFLTMRGQTAKPELWEPKRYYLCLFCFSILTFLLPIGVPICFVLAMKEAILAKVLGRILIPCWFCIGYIISLRGMKL